MHVNQIITTLLKKIKSIVVLLNKRILNCEAIDSSAFYINKAIVAQLARAADL